MSPLTPNPLSSLKVSTHHISAYASFPNTSLHPQRPLYIYHTAFPPSQTTASNIESHLTSIGVVKPAWRYTMYTQHHYHSTTNEVLVVSSGSAIVCFGGSTSHKDKQEVKVGKGDVMIVPAGVGHALLKDLGGFEMVGSYPVGCERWDMCTGEDGVREKGECWERIKGLGWFDRDPIYGDAGPVLDSR